MKMNCGRSNDSLDNGTNDLISSGSSSPTNFTSDDEADDYSGLYSTNRQHNSSIGQKRAAYTSNKADKYPSDVDRFSNRLEHAVQRANALQPLSNSYLTSDNAPHTSIASTSYYNPRNTNNDIDLHPSSIPDVVPEMDTIWNDSLKFDTQVTDDYTTNNYANDDDIFRARDRLMQPPLHIMSGPARNLETVATTMSARLVSCRTLDEAIEFVESQRDEIEDVIRIILEAPAFREYDMASYQIDQSVKDSFNPNFWIDREPVLTTADGNCQYHAISISLTGNECYTQEVRLATAVAVIDNRDWFDSMLKLIDRGSVLDLVHTIARSYSWGDETTLKAIAVAIKRRIFLYTCNIGKKDYEMVRTLGKEELLDAFKEKKYRGGTGIHTYADPFSHVSPNNYIMLFHKSEHFIAVLPTVSQPTMFEPYNPIVPTFS